MLSSAKALEILMRSLYGDLGKTVTQSTYKQLANKVGFEIFKIRNITPGTLPTYKFLQKYANSNGPDNKEITKLYRFQHLIARLGMLRYLVLSFQKESGEKK